MGQEAFLAAQILDFAEATDDRVAALLQAGTGITLTYNDAAGTLTIAAASSFDGSFAALTGKPTTLSGYGITDAQPLDSDLTAIAALTTTTFGRSLLTQADAAATRSTIGVGTGTIGGSAGSTDNAVLRADGTGGSTIQDSAFVIADNATASPNSTVNNASIQATGGTTNVGVSVVPKGSGYFALHVPDGTSAGGNARGTRSVDLQMDRSSASQVASGTESALIGGNRNTVSGPSAGLIAGFDNSVSSITGFIGAGEGNTVSGRRAGCLAGQSNTISGTAAASVGGSSCVASGNNSATVGGFGCEATASQAVAMGSQASAARQNEFTMGFGLFAARGDLEFSIDGLSVKTTNATPTNLALEGGGRLTVPSGKVLAFIARITGIKSDGSACADYLRRGVIKNVGGTTTISTVQTIGTDIEDNASTDVALTADDTNDALQIAVTGISGETWRWLGVVQFSDLRYGT